VNEVAEYLKLSKSKVYYMIRQGEIPYVKIGRNVRIRESDLREYIDENVGYRRDLAYRYR
jgi:putative molybdopterin biosynthesis protein